MDKHKKTDQKQQYLTIKSATKQIYQKQKKLQEQKNYKKKHPIGRRRNYTIYCIRDNQWFWYSIQNIQRNVERWSIPTFP